MKKVIIGILTFVVAGILIGWVLSNNKKKNEQKVEVVSEGTGAAPVKVVAVSRESLDLQFSANGNFVPNQDLQLSAENSGRVTSIRVKEGDYVSKGQVLATIDDKYLSLDLQTANEAYQKLKTDKQRYESSFKTGGVTRAQLDEIELQLRNAEIRVEQAQRRIHDASVKAPFGGVINKKMIEMGAFLSPGTPLFDIVDVSNLKLNVAVNERQVVQLKKGDKVEITVPVFPDKKFTGTISFISSKADAALNFPVEIKVDNQKGQSIKAGMYASANFKFDNSGSKILIPRSAFVGSVNNNEVYVVKGNKAELRHVTPGAVIGERVEILDGLTEGEQVVVSGQINLNDGETVEVQK